MFETSNSIYTYKYLFKVNQNFILQYLGYPLAFDIVMTKFQPFGFKFKKTDYVMVHE